MNNKLSLPSELNENRNHLIIFDCTKLFGEEFGKFCDLKMKENEGPDWLKNLSYLRQQYKTNLFDTAFLLKEALLPDSPFRKILPKSKSFYDKLGYLKRIRNETQHFSFRHTNSATKAVVDLYFDISLELNLSLCSTEYSLLISRINDLELGKRFQPDPDFDSKLSEIEKQKAEMEDELIEKNLLLIERETKYNNVQRVISENNAKIDELIQSNDNKTSAFNDLQRDLEEWKKEATELRIQLSEIESQKESDEITEREIEKIIATFSKNISVLNEDVLNHQSLNTQSLNLDSEVGSAWGKPKGKRKITLSVARRDLVDSKTSKPIEFISEDSRRELAENWLQIRPSGGRVFIDEEGNATTLLGEILVYLGNISDI